MTRLAPKFLSYLVHVFTGVMPCGFEEVMFDDFTHLCCPHEYHKRP